MVNDNTEAARTPTIVLTIRVEYEIATGLGVSTAIEAANELAEKAREYGRAVVKVTFPEGEFNL
jgi:hypothetical protein